jgi:uncharacterized protein (TIGR03437 family)
MKLRRLLACPLAASPVVLFAFSGGPPVLRTGAAVDGGMNCAACHRGADVNDGRGRITITASNYSPGVKQMIRVRVEHPDAMRWGFEITARLESDQTKQAGSFTAGGEIRVACAPSGVAPCGGNLEFATHNATSNSPGTREGRTWELEWTPPDTNAGSVVFYAAGNAANGNNANSGDFIYTTSVSIAASTPGGPRPAITRGGVADAFNFQPSIASSTWLAIVGTNLAPTTQTWDNAIQGQTLPTSLAGVSVRINNRPATIFYVSPTQVNALAPLDDSTGDVSVVVTTPSGDSEPLVVRKLSAAPALFSSAQGGRLFVTAVALDGTFVGKAGTDPRVRRAARPGETIQLFGTGFGATNPAAPTDRLVSGAPELTRKPVIRIADTMANFPGNGNLVAAGLYQFNITIPATLADGDHAIVAEVDGIRSANTVFITVAR